MKKLILLFILLNVPNLISSDIIWANKGVLYRPIRSAISGDGNYYTVSIARGDITKRFIQVWDIQNMIKVAEKETIAYDIDISGDGSIVAYTNNKSFYLWDWKKDIILANDSTNGNLLSLKFVKDKPVIAVEYDKNNDTRSYLLYDYMLKKIEKDIFVEPNDKLINFNPIKFGISDDGNTIIGSFASYEIYQTDVKNNIYILNTKDSTNKQFQVSSKSIIGFNISADGRLSAAYACNYSYDDNDLILIDNIKGDTILTYPLGKFYVREICFDNTGNIVKLYGSGSGVIFFDIQKRKIIKDIKDEHYFDLAKFCSDSLLLTYNLAEVVKWKLTDQMEKVKVVSDYTGDYHVNSVFAVDISPDKKIVATGGSDTKIKFWNSDNGTLLFELKDISTTINGLKFSPDGKQLASIADYPDNKLIIWDLQNRIPVKSISEFSGNMTDVQWSPNGASIAVSSTTDSVKIYDTSTWTNTYSFDGGYYVKSISFSKINNWLAIGNEGKILQVFDLNQNKLLHKEQIKYTDTTSLFGGLNSIDFSYNDSLIIVSCGDGFGKLYETQTWKGLKAFSTQTDGIWTTLLKATFIKNAPDIISIGASDVILWNWKNQDLKRPYPELSTEFKEISIQNFAKADDDSYIVVVDYYGDVIKLKGWYITSVNNFENPDMPFAISPNPASDFISINTSEINRRVNPTVDKVEIYSIEGMLMQSTSPQPSPFSERAIQIDVSSFVPGVYFLKIGDRVQRFVKM